MGQREVHGRAGEQERWEGVFLPLRICVISVRSTDASLLEIQLVASEPVRILNPVFLFFPQVSIFSFVAKGLVLNSNNDYFRTASATAFWKVL